MLEAGALGYLVKGASPSEIQEAIFASARGEGALSSKVAAEVVRGISEQLRTNAEDAETLRVKRARVERVLAEDGLRIAFQPIVELSTGNAVGFEALTRTGEAVGPGELFAEASEVGLRSELELAALQAAVSKVSELPPGTFLSVNLSPEVIVSSPLLELLGKASVSRTVIEVTEHAPVSDYAALARAVRPARALGARLAVDDAGAGYASLRHVLELEPDIIKLDVNLVRNLDADRGTRALASALLTFAAEMDQLVIAEGVETARMAEVLEGLGVRYGQGYHFAQPIGHLPDRIRA
jgi:EAL domain-containing protein (putative c-di-GMP-specific phosphodiesterase class I)